MTARDLLEQRFQELRGSMEMQQRVIGQTREDAQRRQEALAGAKERLVMLQGTWRFLHEQPALDLKGWKGVKKSLAATREAIKALQHQIARSRGQDQKLVEGLAKLQAEAEEVFRKMDSYGKLVRLPVRSKRRTTQDAEEQ